MPNLDLVPKRDVSNFRKIAIGTWTDAYDPSVYGTLTLRMDEAVRYIDAFRAATGKRLTVSHMLAKAAATALAAVPDANAVLRFNRVYLRRVVGVFFQVAMTDEGDDKTDLSGCTLYGVDKMSLSAILDEFERKVEIVRARKDPALEKTRNTFQAVPYLLLNVFLRLLSFLTLKLNLDLRWAGVPQDPFGSIMITNIGSLGLDQAFVPLVPYSGVPILVAAGAVTYEAVVEAPEGGGAPRIVPARTMKLCATFDHRFIDGVHAAKLARLIKRSMEAPFEHFDPIPGAPVSP